MVKATHSSISAAEFKRSRKIKIIKEEEGRAMDSPGQSWQQMAGEV